MGLIPGLGYFAIFLGGILGAIDSVQLLAARLPAWFAPFVMGSLMFSAILGLSNGRTCPSRSGLRACALLAISLLVAGVPLLLAQLVSLFTYFD